ncbi:hypothetical protein HHI36_023386 [Cryptolaemus montrouzieri]|uniref:Uncharacterized protein n=1 Tax=Cryptolaemus montrouzieri TaxID=559131 RepID=A0ABD2PGT6_9CUCU
MEIELPENNLNNCHRVGLNRKRGPLVVELSSFRLRHDVHSNAFKLKNTPVSCCEDLISEDRAVRRVLIDCLKKARKGGRKAQSRGRFLFIDNKKYTADELTQANGPYYGASSV